MSHNKWTFCCRGISQTGLILSCVNAVCVAGEGTGLAIGVGCDRGMEAVITEPNILRGSLRRPSQLDTSGGLVSTGGSPVNLSSSLRRGSPGPSPGHVVSPHNGPLNGLVQPNSPLNTSLRSRRSDSLRASVDHVVSPSAAASFNPLTKAAEHGDMAGVRNLLTITPGDQVQHTYRPKK